MLTASWFTLPPESCARVMTSSLPTRQPGEIAHRLVVEESLAYKPERNGDDGPDNEQDHPKCREIGEQDNSHQASSNEEREEGNPRGSASTRGTAPGDIEGDPERETHEAQFIFAENFSLDRALTGVIL